MKSQHGCKKMKNKNKSQLGHPCHYFFFKNKAATSKNLVTGFQDELKQGNLKMLRMKN